jgi:acyl-CoA reductase-like NAD-dependent aldehyde dehydrogenase
MFSRILSVAPVRRGLCTTARTEHIPLWINGKACEAVSGATLPVEDPSTGEIFATTALASKEDVDAAVASAHACHTSGYWRALGTRGRGKVLRTTADLLRERLPALIEVETKATGRPKREFQAQLGRVPEWLEYHASLAESMEGAVPPFADATDHIAVRYLSIERGPARAFFCILSSPS